MASTANRFTLLPTEQQLQPTHTRHPESRIGEGDIGEGDIGEAEAAAAEQPAAAPYRACVKTVELAYMYQQHVDAAPTTPPRKKVHCVQMSI